MTHNPKPFQEIPSSQLEDPRPPSPQEPVSPLETISGDVEHSRLAVWAHRIFILLFVLVCTTFGIVLIILPWRTEWTDNYLLLRYPAFRPFVASGFFRGLCTGLGVLDVWLAFWEAVHYQEKEH